MLVLKRLTPVREERDERRLAAPLALVLAMVLALSLSLALALESACVAKAFKKRVSMVWYGMVWRSKFQYLAIKCRISVTVRVGSVLGGD